MKNLTRTHRLTLKNSVSDLKTIGYIIADAEAAAIISGLIEAKKLYISLDDAMDINALTRLLFADKSGQPRMQNFPMIWPMDKAAAKPTAIQQDNAVITPKATTTAADDIPF